MPIFFFLVVIYSCNPLPSPAPIFSPVIGNLNIYPYITLPFNFPTTILAAHSLLNLTMQDPLSPCDSI